MIARSLPASGKRRWPWRASREVALRLFARRKKADAWADG